MAVLYLCIPFTALILRHVLLSDFRGEQPLLCLRLGQRQR